MTGSPYLRAVDPFPLQSAEYNKLHGVYDRLAAGRLATTRCTGCGRLDWPPRGFCPACASDAFEWTDLPSEGRVHGFTVQETGVPAGYPRPLVFAMVEVAGLRIFAPLVRVGDVASLRVGMAVRLEPLRVTDDPQGQPRFLPAFAPTHQEASDSHQARPAGGAAQSAGAQSADAARLPQGSDQDLR